MNYKEVRTIKDAIGLLGLHNELVAEWITACAYCSKDLEAFAALKVVAEALRVAVDLPREGKDYWAPFYFYADYSKAVNEGLASAVISQGGSGLPRPQSLALTDKEVAEHFAREFAPLWQDYYGGGLSDE